mgnify:CR=1 FL=1
MSRNEEKIFILHEAKQELRPGEVLPSEKTLFQAKKIFLFCEGKTEFQYFSEYKQDLSNSRLEIIPRYPDQSMKEGPDVEQLAIQVIGSRKVVQTHHEGMKRSIEVEDIDDFCILFDYDKNFHMARDGTTKYQKARILTGNTKVEYFLSNYCFEVWVLCHFKKPDRRMKTRGLEREILKGSGWSKYKKGQKEIYSKIRDRLPTAKENASKLITEKKEKKIPYYSDDSNPFTEISMLIEKIEHEAI